jgi:hypothetical protein
VSPPDAPHTLLDTLLETPANYPHEGRFAPCDPGWKKNVTEIVTEHPA